MAITSNAFQANNYLREQTGGGLAYAPSQAGGVENVRIGTVAFTDTSAKTLFQLPRGAVVTQVQVDVNTAFDAGTTNTLDVGTGATADNLVDGADVSSIARLFPVQDVPTLTPLTANTDVTATFIPSGTAATVGAAYVTVRYIMVESA